MIESSQRHKGGFTGHEGRKVHELVVQDETPKMMERE